MKKCRLRFLLGLVAQRLYIKIKASSPFYQGKYFCYVRHSMDVLHASYIDNIFYDKMDFSHFYCNVMILSNKTVIAYDSVLEICEITFGYFKILIVTSYVELNIFQPILGQNIFFFRMLESIEINRNICFGPMVQPFSWS